jgi:hypothetical protein
MRCIVVGSCIASLLIPPGVHAAEPVNLVAVRDVALAADGSLRGALLNLEGKPQPHSDVLLRKGTEIVAAAKTNADGRFTIQQVRPGVYELAASRSANLYRVWSARMAPPAAQSNAVLIQTNPVVRGQEEWSPVRRAVILGGVIVTSGVIGGVIGYNIKDEDSAS